MTKIFQIWTDYDTCEIFADISSAEAFCFNTYGPNKKTWPEIAAVVLRQTSRKPLQKYHAIAWWPDWTYEKPPQKAHVESCYGTAPEGVGAEEAQKALRFHAEGKTKKAAEAAARVMAENKRPRYIGGQSSNTTSGRLEIFRQAQLPKRLWDWSDSTG